MNPIAVKFADGADDVIEGPGMPFGGPFNGQDAYGEHFTKSTDFALSWFPDDGRPLLYHHGLDSDAAIVPVGRVKGYEIKADIGVWTRAQLDKSSEYFGAIKELVKAGKLFFSSGAMAHLVEVDRKSGEIRRWPWVELSLTPTPANLLATVDFATATKHYKSAGLDIPESVKATLDAAARNELTDADFAYIDKDGGRHLPINDEAHVRNAIARFGQAQFESEDAKAKARTKILAAAKKLGIEVSEESLKALSVEQMRALVTDAGMEMSEDDMKAMLAEMPDCTEEDMKACLAKKKAAKSAPEGIKARQMAGSYEDVISRIEAACNPCDPMTGERSWNCSVVATYADHCLIRRYEPTGPCTYWDVPYSIDEAGVVQMGEAVQMEQTYQPVRPERPMGLMAFGLSIDAAELAECTKGLSQRRLKEGRMISDANRKRLAACMEEMGKAMGEMQSLLDSTAPQSAKAAAVRRQADKLRLFAATMPQR